MIDNRSAALDFSQRINYSDVFPFNHFENDDDFLLAIKELTFDPNHDFNTNYLNDLVFHPFTFNKHLLTDKDLDPDLQFFNTQQNLISNQNYLIADEFNDKYHKKTETFSLIHYNIRSLSKNFDKMSNHLDLLQHEFSIIGISETWLKNNDSDFYNLNKYTLITCNRESRQGGGVALYIKDDLTYKIRDDLGLNEDNICQSLFTEVNIDNRKVIIGVIYRPPNSDMEKFNDYIDQTLTCISKSKSIAYIMGDFNINLLNFEKHEPTNMFLQNVFSHSLFPTITKPTRLTCFSATLIDNILTNNYQNKVHSGVLCSDISDHFPIFQITEMKTESNSTEDYQVVRDINQDNIDSFKTTMENVDWHYIYEISDPEKSYEYFIDEFSRHYNNCFPFKRIKKNKFSPRKPWMTQGLFKSIKRKNKLYRKFKLKPNDHNQTKYKQYRNKLNHLIKITTKNYYTQKLENAKNSLKDTWRILKDLINKKKSKLIYPNTFSHNNKEISNTNEIAQTFNEYFTNIGPNLASIIPQTNNRFQEYLPNNYPQSFLFLPTDNKETSELINEIKPKNSSGHDGINPCIVKQVNSSISSVLAHIFNNSMKTGTVPHSLKVAKVIPIYKAGDPTLVSNYRPVSVLPCFSKIMEKLVYKRLLKYLEKHNILYIRQYGFRQKHSTYMALLDVIDKITQSLDNKEYAFGIFIDLSKAFDTIDHNILLDKLHHYGIRGNQNLWFKNYLNNRKQFTQVNGCSSSHDTIKCGVPQGSILGPLLFLLYVNDINVSSSLLNFIMFADDTNIFFSHKDFHTAIHTINTELKKVSTWFKVNKLSLNISKTNFILFRNKNKEYSKSDLKLIIDDKQITQVDSSKFLGVFISQHLDWKSHINHVALKISKTIGVINKISYFVSANIRRSLYNTLILPYIQYCNIVWAIRYPTHLDKIFKLQKRIVRIIAHSHYLSHTKPLFQKYNLMTVYDINKFQIGVFLYKYINNRFSLSPVFHDFFVLNNQIHKYSTRSANRFHLPKARTNARKCSLKYIGAELWNSLPDSIKAATSLSLFKFSFRKYLINL